MLSMGMKQAQIRMGDLNGYGGFFTPLIAFFRFFPQRGGKNP